jgi:peptide/nickel transport system permease protein
MDLKSYIARRLLLAIPTILGVTLIVFFISHVVPADPALVWAGGARARPEQVEQIRQLYNLDEPIWKQYIIFLSDLVRGDLGISPVTGRPVIEDIKTYFPATLELTIFAIALAIIIGIPLGVLSAIKKDSPVDHSTRIFALSGYSMPIFWLGLILQLVVYYYLGLVPDPGGRVNTQVYISGEFKTYTNMYLLDSLIQGRFDVFFDALQHLILPGFTLAYATAAIIARMTRSSMLEVIRQDYIEFARARGLPERVVIYKHALRNAMIPTVTVVGLSFGGLLAGAVLTETVFYWPGIGRYMVGTINTLDFPALMGGTILIALVFVIVNLLVDILYAIIDPRIRYG